MKLLSRKDAKAQGLSKYFTGEPCKHGHVAERYTTSATCVPCIYDSNGRTPVANEDDAPKGPSKASLLATMVEQRFRVFHVDAPTMQRMATSLCLAAHPTLTEDDVRSRKGAAGISGPTAMYTYRFPPEMQPFMQALANNLFGAHSQANVDQFRANLVRKAQDLAIESRPPIPEWENK